MRGFGVTVRPRAGTPPPTGRNGRWSTQGKGPGTLGRPFRPGAAPSPVPDGRGVARPVLLPHRGPRIRKHPGTVVELNEPFPGVRGLLIPPDRTAF
ncbi:hypothetical protein GCM10010294_66800 [Streptomyces griseoloalbus]|nr:hypothetical protein GCM10010294_66800 [Streptomyces griseoloalbus]